MTKPLFTSNEFVIFTTRNFAQASNISVSSASRALKRFESLGALTHITRGIWANTTHPYFSPLCCVPYLLGREQGYISFLTALHLHGLVSQIPARVQIATTGHSRLLKSPVATYEFFQIKPQFMQAGIEWSATVLPYRMAQAEKALLDVRYIATRKGRRFASLPELDLSPELFDQQRYRELVDVHNLPKPLHSLLID